MKNLPAYSELLEFKTKIKDLSLADLFTEDPQRAQKFSAKTENLFFDFSKQPINSDVFNGLLALAEQSELKKSIENMFSGCKINSTENRKVLHTALRGKSEDFEQALSPEERKEIQTTLQRVKKSTEAIRTGDWKGCTGKRIRHLVNIGIGGSDLGAVMATQALTAYVTPEISFHFVSNVDPADLSQTLSKIDDPESALFIVASKTFTTQETLANAEAAKNWMERQIGEKFLPDKHFIGISSNVPLAQKFGISGENVYPLWDWVGGRYSVCSAVGFSLAVAIGGSGFQSMLDGFAQMDRHFKTADFSENIPVIMALLGIWSINFLQRSTLAILPYSHYLSRFPAYLQQLDMESNGKSVTLKNSFLDYETAPVIWGEAGTNGQHAFFQAMHQGTPIIPADFIGFMESCSPIDDMHDLLMSNFFAQQEALAFGKSKEKLRMEGIAEDLIPHRTFLGNRPSSCLLFQKLTPFTLGQLIALYEHKVFTQGIIWQINSFDQWGVELGKKLAGNILEEIRAKKQLHEHDSSTANLLQLYLRKQL